MDVRPIRNSQDHEEALKRIESLMNAEPHTKEADELEVLSILVETYERERYG